MFRSISVCAVILLLACGCTTATVVPDGEPAAEDDAEPLADDATSTDDGSGSDGTTGACQTAGCPCTAHADCANGLCDKGKCAACVPAKPPVEGCNGADDDCDGKTDEDTCPWPSDCIRSTCDAAEKRCVTTVLTDTMCSDGNACTQGDGCNTGMCLSFGPVDCDDQTPCTADSCNPASGCVHAPVDATCTDDNGCTLADHCADGACAGTAKLCNDGNVCTNDDCNPGDGVCLATANTASCDDGDGCTVGDHCQGSACMSVPKQCDDKNACTDDACVPGQGCVHVPNAKTPPDCAGLAPSTPRVATLQARGRFAGARLTSA